MNGLDRIIEGILCDAKSKHEKIIVSAKADAEDIVRRAKETAKNLIDKAKLQAETEYNRMIKSAVSATAVTEKRILLRERREILNSIISKAKEKISMLDAEEYFVLMERLLNKCATGESGEIILSDHYKARATKSFTDAIKAKALVISDKTREIDTGFVLVYGDIEENCSVTAIMESDSERLYDAVNSFLF